MRLNLDNSRFFAFNWTVLLSTSPVLVYTSLDLASTTLDLECKSLVSFVFSALAALSTPQEFLPEQ